MKNIIHCDISIWNFLLNRNINIKLSDFKIFMLICMMSSLMILLKKTLNYISFIHSLIQIRSQIFLYWILLSMKSWWIMNFFQIWINLRMRKKLKNNTLRKDHLQMLITCVQENWCIHKETQSFEEVSDQTVIVLCIFF